MVTYKITNITNTLNKRDPNFNSKLSVSFVDQMEKKTMVIEPNSTIYLTSESLPLSLQKYRIKGYVTLSEISQKELNKLQSPPPVSEKKKMKVEPKVKAPEVTTTTTTKRPYKKKSTSTKK